MALNEHVFAIMGGAIDSLRLNLLTGLVNVKLERADARRDITLLPLIRWQGVTGLRDLGGLMTAYGRVDRRLLAHSSNVRLLQ